MKGKGGMRPKKTKAAGKAKMGGKNAAAKYGMNAKQTDGNDRKKKMP